MNKICDLSSKTKTKDSIQTEITFNSVRVSLVSGFRSFGFEDNKWAILRVSVTLSVPVWIPV